MCCYRQEVTQVNVASGWNLKANAQGCKTQAHLCPRTPVAAPCPRPGECCSSGTGICFFAGRSPPIYIQKTFILFFFFFTQPSPPPFLFLTRKTNSNSSSFGGRSLLTRAPSGGTIWGCYQRAASASTLRGGGGRRGGTPLVTLWPPLVPLPNSSAPGQEVPPDHTRAV